ncbi:MAG: hypothetical protein J6S09_10470 [Paludibacteraceae bacterium]|nr:hypothetical protein [Paludibacteraceae bacterium]
MKKQKNAEKLHFFAEIFGHIKKKQYLCTRFQKGSISVTNGIKAITSDFGSENLGSIPGWSTKKPACRAFFERNLMCDGIRAATPTA